MRLVRVLDAAAEDAAEAAAWYEAARPGLGVEFEHAVTAALDLLEQEFAPLTAASGNAGAHGVKRVMLRKFPYDVVVAERNDSLLVLALAHHARRPGYWRDRLGS